MHGQQAAEGNRPRRRRSQRTLAKPVAAVHQQQQPLHQPRHACDAAMARFIGSKVSGSECRAKRNCLAKCQPEPFTRNRIKRAGRVSHQRNPASSHGRQFGGYGNRAALRPQWFCAREVPCKPRKQGWNIRDTPRFFFRNKRYAHLLRPYRSQHKPDNARARILPRDRTMVVRESAGAIRSVACCSRPDTGRPTGGPLNAPRPLR